MDQQRERVPIVPDPQFGGIDAVPVRAFAGVEQEQDRGGEIPPAARVGRTHRLPKPPALGMRGEVQASDERMRHAQAHAPGNRGSATLKEGS